MPLTPGETALQKLIANMEPVLNEGEYVFASVSDINAIPREITICEIKEKEGVTVIVSKKDAERLGLPFEFVAAWITLNIHSALEAVGLTAAFASALGENNISCNVVAGYYHDHIFVDTKDKYKAMVVLQALTKMNEPS
ncbi:MAG: ACT domain-containing protein [Saprospiraceae bacterium]|nr:ACT domain-containing protein [Saprospiraceae bacterium]